MCVCVHVCVHAVVLCVHGDVTQRLFSANLIPTVVHSVSNAMIGEGRVHISLITESEGAESGIKGLTSSHLCMLRLGMKTLECSELSRTSESARYY